MLGWGHGFSSSTGISLMRPNTALGIFLCYSTLLLGRLPAVSASAEDFSSPSFRVGFYENSCAGVESMIYHLVKRQFKHDPTIAASMIRVAFHDSFVQGADASILLKGRDTELTAGPNLSVRGLKLYDHIKAAVEAVCPGVVSCADIIQLVARDSVKLLGGKSYHIKTGRYDSKTSGKVDLPGPRDSIPKALSFFTKVGLNTDDFVTLLGSHTVGVAQCQFYTDRLYNFSGTFKPDPTLNPDYRAYLETKCPLGGTPTTNNALDPTSDFIIDNNYFSNIEHNSGLLQIDQELLYNEGTSGLVKQFASSSSALFKHAFAKAMVKMSEIGVKGPGEGEIRTICSHPI